MRNTFRTFALFVIVMTASVAALAQFPWNLPPAGPTKKIDVAVIKRDAAGKTYFDGTTTTIGLYPKGGSLPNNVEALNEKMFSDGMCAAGTPAQQAACRLAVADFTGTFVLPRNSNAIVKPVDGTKKIARVYFSLHFMYGVPEGTATIDKIGSGMRTNVNVIEFSSEQLFTKDNEWGMLVNGEYHWGTQLVNKNLTIEMFTYGTLPINRPIVAGQAFYMNGNHDNSGPNAYKTPIAWQTAMWFAQLMGEDLESQRIEMSFRVGGGPYASVMKIHIHGVEFAQ